MNWNEIPRREGRADFGRLLSVLRRGGPDRPPLFEFLLNDRLIRRAALD